jgi:hypothetical protein
MSVTHNRLALILLLTIITGCGQAKYDELLEARHEELANPHLHGILIWEEFVSPEFGYTVTMPKGEETLDSAEENGIETETRDVTFGSKRYQFVYTLFPNTSQPEEFAKTVEDQYRASGYVDIPEDQIETPPLPATRTVKSLHLMHPEYGRARVEVVPLNNRSVGTLAVLGTDVTEDDCTKFFQSPSVPRRQPRRRN